MPKDHEAILSKSPEKITAPKGLFEIIIKRIEAQEVRTARIRFFSFGALSLVLSGGLFYAFKLTLQEIIQSDLSHFLSLIFSDTALVLTSWKEYLLTLTESAPLNGITILLAISFAVIWSIKYAAKNEKSANLYPKLIN